MRTILFTKTNLQMLVMSLAGVAIMVAISLYVSSSLKPQGREPASVETPR